MLQPQILFFAGASGLLEGLGDIAGDGGQAVQNIMASLNAMPAMDNLQEFVNMSGLEQGIESMRLGAQRGLTQEDIPAFLRGMGPMALESRRVPLGADIAPGAPPLSGGVDYESLLRKYTGQPLEGAGSNIPGYIPEERPSAEERMSGLGGYADVPMMLAQMEQGISSQTPSSFAAGPPPAWTAPTPGAQVEGTYKGPSIFDPANWATKTIIPDLETGKGPKVEDKPKGPSGPDAFTPEGGWLGQVQPQEKDFVLTNPDFDLTPIPSEYGYPKGVFIRKADIQGRTWDKNTFGSILPMLWKYDIVVGPKGRVGMLRGQGGPWTPGSEPDWVKKAQQQWKT
jgi:hypothetical protein